MYERKNCQNINLRECDRPHTRYDDVSCNFGLRLNFAGGRPTPLIPLPVRAFQSRTFRAQRPSVSMLQILCDRKYVTHNSKKNTLVRPHPKKTLCKTKCALHKDTSSTLGK